MYKNTSKYAYAKCVRVYILYITRHLEFMGFLSKYIFNRASSRAFICTVQCTVAHLLFLFSSSFPFLIISSYFFQSRYHKQFSQQTYICKANSFWMLINGFRLIYDIQCRKLTSKMNENKQNETWANTRLILVMRKFSTTINYFIFKCHTAQTFYISSL